MQKVLGDYKNGKKLLNYSKQNPLQSFYKRDFICWLIIAINFEERDVFIKFINITILYEIFSSSRLNYIETLSSLSSIY